MKYSLKYLELLLMDSPGLAAHEDTVNERRQKLREVLLREQMSLTREVVDQAQHGDDARMDEMRERTEQLRKQQEEQRLALVAAKRMQQYLARCPEIREQMAKKYTVEVKESNLIQMAENEAKRRENEEIEKLWHNLMLRDVEAKKEREVEEAKTRCLGGREVVMTLEKQIAGKLALEEQKKQIQEEDREYVACLKEEMRKEELERLENERRKRDALKKELQGQVLGAKRRLAEKARREAEMDRLRDTLAAAELAKEKSKIKESSVVLRRELLAYLQYLEDVRKEEAMRDVAVDRIIEESAKEANARRDLAVKQFKEARKRVLQDVLRGRDEQMELQRQRERDEEEKRRLEREEMEKAIETEAKLTIYARQEDKDRKLRYKRDLEEQRKCADDCRRREAEGTEKWYREEAKRREEDLKLTDELLTASEDITPHPFKVLLKQCAARYAAEKEGQCYCPPPLSAE
ncbi:cilia- and flagella-associated protein 53 [Nomia melanderi]|uniref:cilia- and flagella-associated protein 53 n=1 Tax=Nomia melanderi TaxID=2448451 RepID=UPI003FCEC5BB